MVSQNQHISRINHNGTILVSSGVSDTNKLVKTSSDGKIDSSCLNVGGLLQGATVHQYDIIHSNVTQVIDTIDNNNMVISEGYDSTLFYYYKEVKSIGVSQSLSFVTVYTLPTLFSVWNPNAITGTIVISDQSEVSVDSEIIAISGKHIITKNYVDMVKVLIGAGPETTVTFNITNTEMFPLGTEKYGLINDPLGYRSIMVKTTVTANANHWGRYHNTEMKSINFIKQPDSWG